MNFDPEKLATACKSLGLRLVVAFGSRIRGPLPPAPDSDLDLGLLGIPAKKIWEAHPALATAFPDYLLDLVSLDDADPLLRQEVMAGSKLLYGDPDLYWNYRNFAYRDYVDSADLRALQFALYLRKMRYIREAIHAPV